MITYATLDQLRERLNIPAGDAATDVRLLRALRGATAQIDRYTARRFAPVVQTRRYDYQTPYSLRLDLDLLEVLAVTNGNGAPLDPGAVTPLPDGDGPRHALMIAPGSGETFVPGGGRAIAVRGIWGWHDAWSEAWQPSGDAVQDDPLSAGSSLIAVSDADGAGRTAELSPRFQRGQLLRLDDEYAHVTAVDAQADTISVIRGVRGTLAESHPAGTAIAVYVPPEDVVALCLRWAAWLYQQVDAAVGAGADWLYPAELPGDLRQLLAPLRLTRVA